MPGLATISETNRQQHRKTINPVGKTYTPGGSWPLIVFRFLTGIKAKCCSWFGKSCASHREEGHLPAARIYCKAWQLRIFFARGGILPVPAREAVRLDDIDRKRCIICEKKNAEGIILRGKLICEECEREIINAGILSSRYDFYLERLKQIWEPEAGRHF